MIGTPPSLMPAPANGDPFDFFEPEAFGSIGDVWGVFGITDDPFEAGLSDPFADFLAEQGLPVERPVARAEPVITIANLAAVIREHTALERARVAPRPARHALPTNSRARAGKHLPKTGDLFGIHAPVDTPAPADSPAPRPGGHGPRFPDAALFAPSIGPHRGGTRRKAKAGASVAPVAIAPLAAPPRAQTVEEEKSGFLFAGFGEGDDSGAASAPAPAPVSGRSSPLEKQSRAGPLQAVTGCGVPSVCRDAQRDLGTDGTVLKGPVPTAAPVGKTAAKAPSSPPAPSKAPALGGSQGAPVSTSPADRGMGASGVPEGGTRGIRLPQASSSIDMPVPSFVEPAQALVVPAGGGASTPTGKVSPQEGDKVGVQRGDGVGGMLGRAVPVPHPPAPLEGGRSSLTASGRTASDVDVPMPARRPVSARSRLAPASTSPSGDSSGAPKNRLASPPASISPSPVPSSPAHAAGAVASEHAAPSEAQGALPEQPASVHASLLPAHTRHDLQEDLVDFFSQVGEWWEE